MVNKDSLRMPFLLELEELVKKLLVEKHTQMMIEWISNLRRQFTMYHKAHFIMFIKITLRDKIEKHFNKKN